MTVSRLWRALKSPSRLGEVLLCRRATPQWVRLTAAYLQAWNSFPFTISTTSGPFEFTEPSDVPTFWQVFFAHVYPVRSSDCVIIDAGANIGTFTLFALHEAPEATITAVEPARTCVARLDHMIRVHGFQSRVRIVDAALGATGGTTTIGYGEAGSQFHKTGVGSDQVRMCTLDSVLELYPEVDLLKVDIEGAEFDVLPASRLLPRVRRIAMEYHPDEGPGLAGLMKHLERDFTVTGLTEQGGGYGLAYLINRGLTA